jgi:hypothetical protein
MLFPGINFYPRDRKRKSRSGRIVANIAVGAETLDELQAMGS